MHKTRQFSMTEPREWSIRLPWASLPLSANGREGWRKKAAITAEIRDTMRWLLKAAKIPPLVKISVQLIWVASTVRRRDTDNTVATMKPVVDAIVDEGIVPDDTTEFVTRLEADISVQPHVDILTVRIKEIP